jgi:DNA-directed RNA polymerase specialized sigma24 family protein
VASKSYYRKRKAAQRVGQRKGGATTAAKRKAARTTPPRPRKGTLRPVKPRHVKAATIIKLHTIDGLTYQQIADRYGITKGAVAQRMARMGAKRRARGRPRNRYQCAAHDMRTGKRCTRRVKKKGDTCWSHNRRKTE